MRVFGIKITANGNVVFWIKTGEVLKKRDV